MPFTDIKKIITGQYSTMRATFLSTSGFMNYFSSPAPKTLVTDKKKTDWDSSVNCREDQKIIWAKGGGGGVPSVVLNSSELFSHRQSHIIRNSEPCFLQSYGDFLC